MLIAITTPPMIWISPSPLREDEHRDKRPKEGLQVRPKRRVGSSDALERDEPQVSRRHEHEDDVGERTPGERLEASPVHSRDLRRGDGEHGNRAGHDDHGGHAVDRVTLHQAPDVDRVGGKCGGGNDRQQDTAEIGRELATDAQSDESNAGERHGRSRSSDAW